MAEKLQTLQEAPRPTNVSELKSYLGGIYFFFSTHCIIVTQEEGGGEVIGCDIFYNVIVED